jgi:hypothetical protein
MGESYAVFCRSRRGYRLDKATGEITQVAVWDETIAVDWDRIVAQELATRLDTGLLKEIVRNIPSTLRHNWK